MRLPALRSPGHHGIASAWTRNGVIGRPEVALGSVCCITTTTVSLRRADPELRAKAATPPVVAVAWRRHRRLVRVGDDADAEPPAEPLELPCRRARRAARGVASSRRPSRARGSARRPASAVREHQREAQVVRRGRDEPAAAGRPAAAVPGVEARFAHERAVFRVGVQLRERRARRAPRSGTPSRACRAARRGAARGMRRRARRRRPRRRAPARRATSRSASARRAARRAAARDALDALGKRAEARRFDVARAPGPVETVVALVVAADAGREGQQVAHAERLRERLRRPAAVGVALRHDGEIARRTGGTRPPRSSSARRALVDQDQRRDGRDRLGHRREVEARVERHRHAAPRRRPSPSCARTRRARCARPARRSPRVRRATPDSRARDPSRSAEPTRSRRPARAGSPIGGSAGCDPPQARQSHVARHVVAIAAKPRPGLPGTRILRIRSAVTRASRCSSRLRHDAIRRHHEFLDRATEPRDLRVDRAQSVDAAHTAPTDRRRNPDRGGEVREQSRFPPASRLAFIARLRQRDPPDRARDARPHGR